MLIQQNVTYWHNLFFSETLKTEIIIKTGSFFIDPLIISTPTNTGGFLIFVAVV